MEVVIWLFGLCFVPADFNNDYRNFETFITERKYAFRKKYRPLYHLSSPVGWLSDPAGFIHFKSLYHLFYQYYPYNGVWAPIHWGHAVSNNLVDWKHYPPALMPKDYYEKHGCLAGTAVIRNSYLTLFYTGHVMSNNKSYETQNVAVSADSIIFQKYLYNPVIRGHRFGIGDVKNPKVWRHHLRWYMMVGTVSEYHNGRLLLYSSTDLFNWQFQRILAESYGDMGYMWENPDIVEIDGLEVLILSARGIRPDGYRFRNMYQTGYVVGKFNYNTLQFEDVEISTATFNELDHGHDFYAAKTAIAPDGRRLLIACLGVWEVDAVEASEGWASMLTLVRELRLDRNGALLMTPVRETINLRTETLEEAWYSPGETFRAESKNFELLVNADTTMKDISLVFEWGTANQFNISYSANHRFLNIDRGGQDGVRRADWFPKKRVDMQIFLDSSAIEVFCGNGEVVFTSRIYPRGPIIVKIDGKTDVHVTQYKLRRSVGYK